MGKTVDGTLLSGCIPLFYLRRYEIFGGKEETDRSLLIFYPEKFSEEMVIKNYEKIFKVIRIELPNNIKYEHREFLSGLMKLGIKREKIGDIIVTDYGADIIALNEISEILVNDLKLLTRFRKSNIFDKLMLPPLPLRISATSCSLDVLIFALIDARGTTILPKFGGKLILIPALFK